MKHRRGIDLINGDYRSDRVRWLSQSEIAELTFSTLAGWYELGAYCPRCEREGWLDRYALSRKWSPGAVFISLVPRLRCRACGNKHGNAFLVRKLPR